MDEMWALNNSWNANGRKENDELLQQAKSILICLAEQSQKTYEDYKQHYFVKNLSNTLQHTMFQIHAKKN